MVGLGVGLDLYLLLLQVHFTRPHDDTDTVDSVLFLTSPRAADRGIFRDLWEKKTFKRFRV